MKKIAGLLAATVAAIAANVAAPTAMAQSATEQFFPVLVYRTGAYAPNGVPFANGYVDYLKLINAKGGINGVKIAFEECEFGYATDRGVECYERLKGKPNAAGFHPLSTGVTFALTDKADADKQNIITMGYGRADTVDGQTFKWNFPLGGTYWDAADMLVQHVGAKEGGLDKLKGKKIALIYHDSPFGKEPIALLQKRAQMHGYELQLLPVTHPGVEQKATWLQVRQSRPDYVFLWGWGVMNSTSIKEAVAVGYPREKMYGVWWSGAEPDTRPAGDGAKGYNALVYQAPAGKGKVHEELLKLVYDKGQGTGKKEEMGEVLYNRGLVAAAATVEAVKRAQTKYGKKALTGEQVRWGLENLAIDDKVIAGIGLTGFMVPLSTSCRDHHGGSASWIQTWDGKQWVVDKKKLTPDMQIIKPMIADSAAKYATEKKLTVRDCAKELS